MNWYIEVLKKYAVFEGRARRMEYWVFVLISSVITIMLGVIDGATGLYDIETGAGLLSTLYSLGVLIPSLAVSVRRLHDTERSAWWLLLLLIPVIGPLVLLVFMFFDSTPGDNRYGPNPKAE